MAKRPWNKGTKGLQVAWNKGKPWSEKSKRKMSIAHKGKTGDKAGNWKGDEAGYFALHLRISKQLGRPKLCEICRTTDKRKRYEWANLTGDYANVKDYRRMCQSCHRRYDNRKKVLK